MAQSPSLGEVIFQGLKNVPPNHSTQNQATWPSTSDNWKYVFVSWPLKVIENKQNVLLAATLQLGSVFASWFILHPTAMRHDGSGHVDNIL